MTKIPDALARRETVYGTPKRPVDYVALGNAYHEAGRPTDALDCALRIEGDQAGHDALVKAVCEAAVKRGDFFVLNRVNTVNAVTEAQWKQGFDVAKSTGKTRFALKFAKQLGDTAEIERLELELGVRVPEEPAEGDEAKAQDAKAEEPKAEAKAEEPKAEEPKADEAKAEDAKAEETADEAKADDAKADEAKAEDAKAEATADDEKKAD